MTDASAGLDELAAALGVEARYYDTSGALKEAPRSTVEALLRQLTDDPLAASEPAAALQRLRLAELSRLTPPVVVFTQGEAAPAAPVVMPRAYGPATLSWSIVLEAGGLVEGAADFDALPLAASLDDDGVAHDRRLLPLPPDLPLGYHWLTVTPPEEGPPPARSRLICAPAMAYRPSVFAGDRRVWGVALQLYGLRSERNWGVGDFTDLREAIALLAQSGADAVGLNPLHALFPDEPECACPYWPNSRLFLNPLYIDVEAAAGFALSEEAQAEALSPEFQARAAALRGLELVDHESAARLKLPLLRLAFDAFERACADVTDDPLAADFQAFCDERGGPLRDFALYCALREALRRDNAAIGGWRDWPAGLRNPASPEVAAFAAREARAVAFHEYLQWQAARQFEACAAAAREAGMALGVYADLAVGAAGGSAESWTGQGGLLQGWAMGAPPDAFSPLGQEWGTTPPNPFALREQAYAPFIDLLRANMRGAGALRIDHILGFVRLFLVPAGAPPADGVYLRFPFEELAAIVKLESERNRCLVIGEDLGTVPEGLSERLQGEGILSYRLFYFSRDWSTGAFLPPHFYPREALVAIGTHDLPPLAGFWRGADIDERERLGLYPDAEAAGRERWYRGEARAHMAQALRQAGFDADETADDPPAEAAHRFVARSGGRLMLASFEDMLGLTESVNVPGTTSECPNWRRKLPAGVGELLQDGRVAGVLAALREERPRPSQ